ncbi:MAG: hypothetical protein OQK55_04440 [Thermoanaerobaculales bacterium]|nr:hypothetical protein [Thermoanaerobaculales bacterium]
METEPGTTRLSVVGISWLGASAALPFALIVAALGQGLGALVGGCHWIGVALPLDRQIWALVNQPVLNFSSLPRAGGYWLGSTLLPLIVAVTIISFLPQARSLVTQLGCVQISWAMSLAAVAVVPVLDGEDGHVVRFLALHGWPTTLVWLFPVAAAAAAFLPALRLLQLARRRRPDIRRSYRLLVVVIHLGVPALMWLGLVSLAHGRVPLAALLAGAAPLMAALAFAWFRYPGPYVRRLEMPHAGEITGLALAAVILIATVWVAGRPLSDGRSAGVLWGTAQSSNNIRPWIEPWSITGEDATVRPQE